MKVVSIATNNDRKPIMRDFFRFLADYLSDPDRYAGIVALVLGLIFMFGWNQSLSLQHQFEPINLIYGTVVSLFALIATHYLVGKRNRRE